MLTHNYSGLGRPAYNKVWYHNYCPDGFCAAMLAWRQLRTQGHEVEYTGVSYNEPPPPTSPTDRILILDFCYDPDTMRVLHSQVAKLTVIDHHKSTAKSMDGVLPSDVFLFDQQKCGAVMTWLFFHPSIAVPKLVLYIQDRDLWQWKLKGSREISASIDTYPKTFEVWNNLFFGSNRTDINTLVSKGSNILDSLEIMTSRLADRAQPWKIGGYDGWVVNSSVLHSEIGHYLLEHKDESFVFGACYTVQNNGIVKFSLRSRENFDCSEIAKTYGGGGHPQAAGFELSMSQFQELYEVNCGQKVVNS